MEEAVATTTTGAEVKPIDCRCFVARQVHEPSVQYLANILPLFGFTDVDVKMFDVTANLGTEPYAFKMNGGTFTVTRSGLLLPVELSPNNCTKVLISFGDDVVKSRGGSNK